MRTLDLTVCATIALLLPMTPALAAGSQIDTSRHLYEAHAPARHGAKPISGGERYRCHRTIFMGLPNCDNPHNVQNAK